MSALDQATREGGPDEQVDTLAIARTLRVPVFPRDPPVSVRVKAAAMEEFMLLSAYWQGELNEERARIVEEAQPFQDEWDTLDGWEPFQRGRTDESVNAAKRMIRPDLWEELNDRRRRVRALINEIERIERDASKVSRAYTMLSGG